MTFCTSKWLTITVNFLNSSNDAAFSAKSLQFNLYYVRSLWKLKCKSVSSGGTHLVSWWLHYTFLIILSVSVSAFFTASVHIILFIRTCSVVCHQPTCSSATAPAGPVHIDFLTSKLSTIRIDMIEIWCKVPPVNEPCMKSFDESWLGYTFELK